MNLGELEGQLDVRVDAFDHKIIYVYEHLDVKSHEGYVKVGETKASRITGTGENMRIKEQNTAADIEYRVLYTTEAVRNNGTVFSDKDIHDLLVAEDIERKTLANSATNRESEWFKTDWQTVKNLIEKYKMLAHEDNQGKIVDFRLRKEQDEAVDITENYYRNCEQDPSIEPTFLWNAKPRFGKTLTAYCFASTIQAKKVLIVTNRPAIADSWYTDFNKFDFADEDQNDGKFRWVFTSSNAVKARLDKPNIYTRQDQLSNPNLLQKNTVHFISLQDIKGLNKDENGENANEFKTKNKWLFDWNWDLVIIDESHEGVDTTKAFRVFDSLNTKFTLHLSGTPFKALASSKFSSKQIYNWSYTDEQFAKNEWPIEAGPNPYAELPKMNIFTYKLSRALEITAEEAKDEANEYAFDLNEFFRVEKIENEDHFVHEDKVKLFIKNLRNPEYEYPFSSKEYRESLRHTFWLLPRVKACQQMKKLLLEDEYFGKNYTSEDIIVAAGDGDDDTKARTALEAVRQRIGEPGKSKHPLETRTITLSCGQLTTGVTIPAWTAVLMLNNCKSPAQYMQAAFRSQNPFKAPTSGGECITKENCFVFDFAPDRILQTLAEMADSGVSDYPPTSREQKVKILINFLPVIAEDDEGKMKYLDANEVLTIPLKLITEEVINRGFMSNRLFENISGIFGCPQSIRDIIAKINPPDGPKSKPPIKPKIRIWTDKDNKIHINEDIIVNTTNGLFGEKKYIVISSDEGKEIQATVKEALDQARENGYSPEDVKAVQKALAKKMPKLVASLPEPAPKPGDAEYYDKEKPDEKPAPKEKSEEEKVRDRLRGFARTIPSFLMAYGTKDTKLSNFGDNVPDEVFEELTNITKEEFKQLRDGMDYEKKDENGKKYTAHFNGLFNENVFNSSVQAFEEKQKQLACYYTSDSEEDIFEYIPPQANNQIFTPKRVVRMMVDMLEKENPGIFNSTTNTFIDLYMKSGMYITEIVRRIFDQTRDKYTTDTACIKHILENQVYGFAPSAILDAITKNYIFGFDEDMVINRDNFAKYDAIPSAKDGTLKQEINKIFNPQGGDMKFTAVVGNPPYQGDNHFQLYPDFYLASRELGEKSILIFPTGWQEPKNANNLSKLNKKEIKEDSQIVYIDNRHNVFPNVPGAEWTNIILWKKGHDNKLDGKQKIYTDGTNPTTKKLLTNKEEQELNPILASILGKVKTGSFKSICDIIYIQNNLNLDVLYSDYPLAKDRIGSDGRDKRLEKNIFKKLDIFNDRPSEKTDIAVIGTDKSKRLLKYTNKKYIDESHPLLYSNKLIVSTASDSNFGGKLSDFVIGEPGLAYTRSFIGFGPFETSQDVEKISKYIKTKFARALLYTLKTTQMNNKDEWANIPLQKFNTDSDINWSKSISDISQQLYKKYKLSMEEISFIEENVKPME